MLCLDVNPLIAAHRRDHPQHDLVRPRLLERINGTEPIGVPDVVLSGFMRIVTNSKAMTTPSSPSEAWSYVDSIVGSPAGRVLRPAERHLGLFRRLADSIDARGNDIADAFIAAYAIENGARLVSDDRGFRRFDGVDLVPLDEF